jgi:hypothetical protein
MQRQRLAVERRGQAPAVARQQVGAVPADRRKPLRTHVDADHLVAGGGEPERSREADVAQAEHGHALRRGRGYRRVGHGFEHGCVHRVLVVVG